MSKPSLRLLVVSGLRSFAADPWQDWLESVAAQFPDALWVRPLDGEWPDADRWADRIDQALAQGDCKPTLMLSHGFGALAVARYAARPPAALASRPMSHAAAQDAAPVAGVVGALLIAPATPERFGLGLNELDARFPFESTLVAATQTSGPIYPWLHGDDARAWARVWGSRFVDAGRGPAEAQPAQWALGQQLMEKHVVHAASHMASGASSVASPVRFAA